MAEQEELTIDLITPLGGTKEDLKLLQNCDTESSEDIVISHNEITSFIQSIGLERVVMADLTDKEKKTELKKKITNTSSTDSHRKDEVSSDKEEGRSDQQKGKAKDDLANNSKNGVSEEFSEVERKLRKLKIKQRTKLLVTNKTLGVGWYDQVSYSADVEGAATTSEDVVQHLRTIGAELIKRETEIYEEMKSNRKRHDVEWLKTVMISGTMSDKLSARVLQIQESPIHHLSHVDALLSVAKKKSKREALLAVDTLQELWVTTLLPGGRKLRLLVQQPLKRLVNCGNDERDKLLLCWCFEEELKQRYTNFLSTLETLSFDTVMNIRNKIVGNLFDLLVQKPEQEQNLLTQLVNKLGDPERKVASRASLFILKLVSKHLNMQLVVLKEIERLLYRPNVQSKAQYYAVCCLNQLVLSVDNPQLANRLIDVYLVFFKSYVQESKLDAKMLSALLTGVNRAFPFTNDDIKSFEEHLNTLFKVVHISPIATSVQSLMLLYQVTQSRPDLSDRYYRALYTKLLDPDLKHTKQQAMFLNVLFKSLKSDPSLDRVKAFLKRILQICSCHLPPFICGSLFLVSELLKLNPTLWPFILKADEEQTSKQDSVDEESAVNSSPAAAVESRATAVTTYQPKARNPLYCKAGNSCLWELNYLIQHYHPSVRAFATTLAKGKPIVYRGDPLQDFTTLKFLEKFIYKNPKQKKSDHGGSIMQPTPKHIAKEFPLNSEAFLKLKESQVREDELFFYKYFASKGTGNVSDTVKDKLRDADMLGGHLNGPTKQGDLDFARELAQQRKIPKPKKRKRTSSDEDESSQESASEEEELHQYSDMDDWDGSDVAEGANGGDGEPSEAEYERILLENLTSSDEESGNEFTGRKEAKWKKDKSSGSGFDVSSMLADADEFAHLLEGSSEGALTGHPGKKQAPQKQLKWEENRSRVNRKLPNNKRTKEAKHTPSSKPKKFTKRTKKQRR